MSEDEKGTPELRLGLQSCLQPGFHLEKQWSPGVSVASPEEFDQFTAQLAQNLLETYSPEHIATIAAQRIILSDMTQCVFEENEAKQDALVQVLTEAIQKAGFLAFRAHRKKATKKRMVGGLDEHNKRAALIGREIQRHAKELWDADTDEEFRVTDVARLVKDAVERDYSEGTPGLARIRAIISSIAPPYARIGGAPKGKRTRSKP